MPPGNCSLSYSRERESFGQQGPEGLEGPEVFLHIKVFIYYVLFEASLMLEVQHVLQRRQKRNNSVPGLAQPASDLLGQK